MFERGINGDYFTSSGNSRYFIKQQTTFTMKTLLPKLFLLIFIVAICASCQQQSACAAYASHKVKPLHKPTFNKDYGRR